MGIGKDFELGKMWQRVSVSNPDDQSRAMLYMEDPHNSDLIASTSFGRHEKMWERLFDALQYAHIYDISILVTAMSIGCEVYDASRIASQMGFENVDFYGHDISPVFTGIAQNGVYPYPSPTENGALHDIRKWFDLNEPQPGYMSAKSGKFSNIHILPPSDIRSLSGKFDVVISNVMNPPPLNLEQVLSPRARHLVLGNNMVLNASPEFAPVVHKLRQYESMAIQSKATLPGDRSDLDIPFSNSL